ncbi:MAG TPA: hypothetical protein PKK10_18785 [Woeseiaceae bacterium]|nr:hypothetical protein [Woeseiaceae bacterium]
MNTQHDDKLLEDAARLATDIAPQRDLWPTIAAGIQAPRTARQPRYFAQAAAVLLLVAATSMLTYTLTKKAPGIVEVPVATQLEVEPAAYSPRYELSSDYTLARDDLQLEMEKELARLSPEARVGVERNLKIIQDAIVEINTALEQEPGNILLQELLQKTYREELNVMRKVGGLTKSVMSRNDI